MKRAIAHDPGDGMLYGTVTPSLPFSPTHAITVRRQHDAADGIGPWSGVWTPGAAGWSQQLRFLEGRDVWTAADQHTLAVRIPRYQLGDPTTLRLAGAVVNGVPANEWKDTVPPGHLPWDPSGGSFYTIDLSGPHAATNWHE